MHDIELRKDKEAARPVHIDLLGQRASACTVSLATRIERTDTRKINVTRAKGNRGEAAYREG